MKFRFFAAFVCGMMIPGCASSGAARDETKAPEGGNMLLYAAAWKQTAAEYRALYYQAFNIARSRLDAALAAHNPQGKRLAVITDIDDTVLTAPVYWGLLIERDEDFFNDAIWDEWVTKNEFRASPGSLDFLNYADSRGVQIFYVSSRDQGEPTTDIALGNLQTLGFPQADNAHVTILRDSSNKEPVQQKIAAEYEVVLMLGDNLNDFQRKYYVKDVDERLALMEEDKARFGTDFIVLPNPTDGHWIRAIFGDSEPPPSGANRKTLKNAAQGKPKG